MPSCIVRSCSNYSYKASERGVRMHTFPNTLERIKVWLRAIPQQFRDQDSFAEEILKTKKTNPYRICSEHFAQECYTSMNGVMYLSRNAVPTIFGPQVSLTKKRFCVDCKKLIADRCSHCPKHQYVYRGDLWKVHHDHLYPSLSPTLDKTHRGITEASPSHKEPMGMWEEASDPVMGKKDKNEERKERILNLTLEIIYLLTGEEYVPKRKSHLVRSQICTDCLLEGSCKRHVTPAVAHLYRSVIQKENDKKILELISNIIQLLTGEVAIRCEDVCIYFSLEEWEYIKANQVPYREGIKEEEPQQLRPLDGEYEDKREIPADLGGTLCYNNEPSKIGAEGADFCADGNLTNPEISPAEQPSPANGIKEEAASCEGGNQSDCSINPLTEQIQGTPNMEMYNFSECHKHFRDKAFVLEHYKTHTGVKPFSCCLFACQSDLIAPQRSQTEVKLFSCSKCGKCFSCQSDLNRHYRIHREKKKCICFQCGKPFTTYFKSKDAAQLQSHSVARPFCSACRKHYRYQSHLTVHQGVYTEETPYSCLQCGKHFKEHLSFIVHQKSHTGEKPFTCSECGKSYTDRSGLRNHKKFHTGEKPFSCSECGKSFTRRSGLNSHLRVHTGEKPFSCSECGKWFTSRTDLTRHLRIHTGEKPFTCTECGKCFSYCVDLKNHRRVHTGEKPFSCSECGKCFTRHSGLNVHLRIHTGEKPFTCNECGKCFARRSQLTTHSQLHTYSFDPMCNYDAINL